MKLTNETASKRLPGSLVLRLTAPESLPRVLLNADETRVCALINGQRTVNEIMRTSGLPGYVTTRVLGSLLDRAVAEPLPAAAEVKPSGRTGNTLDFTDLLNHRRTLGGAATVSDRRMKSGHDAQTESSPGAPAAEVAPGATQAASEAAEAVPTAAEAASEAAGVAPTATEAASEASAGPDAPVVSTAADQAPTTPGPSPLDSIAGTIEATSEPVDKERPEPRNEPGSPDPAENQVQAVAPEEVTAGSPSPPSDSNTVPSGSLARTVSGEMEISAETRIRRPSPFVSFVYPDPSGPEVANVEAETSEPRPVEPPSGIEKRVHVGSYRVVGRLAKGGVGSVYLCSRGGAFGFRRLFALKVIRQHIDKGVDAVQSFENEARIGGKLSHPLLNGVFDAGLYEQQPYLVMPYVEGLNLHELLSGGQPSPAPLVVSVMCDVLRGLQYLHDLPGEDGRALRLVHGDLSPDNILVGVDGSARLTDFGRVRPAGSVLALDAGGLMGKPGFTAPEQLQGQRIDARTDLFSLGIVLWTALTGKTLFVEDTFEATVMAILRRPVERPSAAGAPACLDDICLRALSRNPESRFKSADDMRIALQVAAAANDLLATAAQVSSWVRDTGGEQLAERRRLIAMDAKDATSEAPPPVVRPTEPMAVAPLGRGHTMVIPRQGGTPRMGVPQTAEPKTAETQLPNAWLGPAGWSKRNTMIGAALAVLVGATIAMLGIQAAFQRSPSPVSAAPPAAPQEPTRAAQGNSNAPVPAVSGDAGLNGR